ncbi:MAG TPA: quinone-dependent dihydroorotate dehydrogenase [Sphingomonadales bacterium]|nr:quinone-dependent dihydroorotate dehydrogenase [Sphingomonadales bacterium]
MRPLARVLPPEKAHRLAFPACRIAAAFSRAPSPEPSLALSAAGLSFPNPLGLAAGFDKDAEAPGAMLKLGFGFAEVGTLTPLPQAGNAKPRLFRLTEDLALINRLGFPNGGFAPALARLAAFPRARRPGPLGVNLGANRDAGDPVEDYVLGVKTFAGVADYFALNVSSPNTPGLRDLQLGKNLARLLRAVEGARKEKRVRAPVFLKIAPDLSREDLKVLVDEALAHGLAGLIISNTTLARPASLTSRHKNEMGGLSGKPLLTLSTELLGDAYRLAGGKLVLIGAGGVFSGADAFRKILAGASLVQFYTAMVYEGPVHVRRVLAELASILQKEKFSAVADAVGKGA